MQDLENDQGNGGNGKEIRSQDHSRQSILDEHKDTVHEFTWRSVLIGTGIGCLMAAQNVYFGLRSGSSFGNSIASALIGYAIVKVIFKMKNFNLQEHVILQTAASANVSTIFSGGFSQYILAMTPQVQRINNLGKADDTWEPTYASCAAWLLLASFLGFFMAQPYRTNLIIKQQLPWPTPTATAFVCKALHKVGDNENDDGSYVARKLGYSACFAFAWQWFKWLFNAGGHMEAWPIFGNKAAEYTWTEDWSPAYIAGGMLMNTRTALSMGLGGIYGFGCILPYIASKAGEEGWYDKGAVGIKGAKAYWFLTSLGVVIIESIYHSVKISYKTISNLYQQKQLKAYCVDERNPDEQEPPNRVVSKNVWMIGFTLNAILVVVLMPILFNVRWYLTIPVILYSIPLGYGICFGGALTDTFLISAISKVTIMIFGAFTENIVSLLWLSGVGMITVGSCEFLLSDYQVGHLTNTSPKALFKAQCFAALVGCFVTPLSYKLFLAAFEITVDGKFTAPGGVALRSLAVLFVEGFSILPGHVEFFVIPTMIISLANSVLIDLLPSRYSQYLPNTMAFAIGFYAMASYPLNSVVGATIRLVWGYANANGAKELTPVIAGGMIAGEGFAAITQAIFVFLGINQPKALSISF